MKNFESSTFQKELSVLSAYGGVIKKKRDQRRDTYISKRIVKTGGMATLVQEVHGQSSRS